MFSDTDFELLSVIECLKKTGMPIKDIKTFVDWCIEGDSTIEKRLELIDKRRKAVEEQISQLQETLEILDYKHWYYETAKEAGTCAVHNNMSEKDIPSNLHCASLKLKENI